MTTPKKKSGKRTPAELDAAQKAIAEGLRKLPAQYVECRGLLHAWETLNDYRITGTKGQRTARFLRKDLQCMRGCGVIRRDTFLLRFSRGEPIISEKLNSSYTYPADYQLPSVPRGVKRQVVVYQEQFRRAIKAAGHKFEG